MPYYYFPNCPFASFGYFKDLVISFQRIMLWLEAHFTLYHLSPWICFKSSKYHWNNGLFHSFPKFLGTYTYSLIFSIFQESLLHPGAPNSKKYSIYLRTISYKDFSYYMMCEFYVSCGFSSLYIFICQYYYYYYNSNDYFYYYIRIYFVLINFGKRDTNNKNIITLI